MIAALRRLVADPSVRWLATARIVPLVVAPLSLWLLITRIPLSERGFYLIAINVVALAQLFETGIGTLVVQFAARVRPSERGTLRGAADRWFTRAGVATLAIGVTIGTYVLATGAASTSVPFVVPWAIVLVCVAAYVRIAPLVCLREGGGGAEAVQKMRAVQASAVAVVTLLGLSRGRGIETAAAAGLAQLMVAGAFLWRVRAELPKPDAPEGRLAAQYATEQGKSARVWLALGLTPQLLTPATMALSGAAVAGDMGVHVALALAPAVVSVAWMHARYPRLGALVASGALSTFDDTSRLALRQALLVFGGAAAAVVGVAAAAPWLVSSFTSRTLSPTLVAALLIGQLAMVLFQAMLAWLRAFGDERFASPVLIACAAMAVGGIGGAALGGAFGAAVGYSGIGAVVTVILATGFMRLRAQRLAGG